MFNIIKFRSVLAVSVVLLVLLTFFIKDIHARESLSSGVVTEAPWGELWRKPAAGRTMVFSQSQVKYGHYQNFYRRWLDRPLLHDTLLREYVETKTHAMKYPSYLIDMKVVRELYHIDGLAQIFARTQGYGLPAFEFADRSGIEGFHIFPLLQTAVTEADNAMRSSVIETALASRSALRIDGKLFIIGRRTTQPEEWRNTIKTLREKHGEVFHLITLVDIPDFRRKIVEFDSGKGRLSAASRKQIKDHFRVHLEAFDGLYLEIPRDLASKVFTIRHDFFKSIVVPVMKELYTEERFKDKYLVTTAHMGHYNEGVGADWSPEGTAQLRKNFETAMLLSPDIILMPEWNEVNENTCIQPTVCNGFAAQRILRYYMSVIKDIKPTPNPGDDISRPNIIISYRRRIVPGERLLIELLNVPDGMGKNKNYSCIAELKSLDGKIVKRFEPIAVNDMKLCTASWEVPVEELANERVLIPSLTMRDGSGKDLKIENGLQSISIRSTWNWDRKWVHQPLRDMILPEKAAFDWRELPASWKQAAADETNLRMIAGSFACDEPIAQAEVLEDDDVVYAVDPMDEFKRSEPNNLLFYIEFRSLRGERVKGSVTLKGTENGRWMRDAFSIPSRTPVPAGKTLLIEQNISSWLYGWLISVPRSEVMTAKLVLDFAKEGIKNVSLRDVLLNGIYSQTDDNGFTITASRFYKQPDIPMHVKERQFAFAAPVNPERDGSIFQLRIVTISGKRYYSKPLAHINKGDKTAVPINVYSETSGKGVSLSVPREHVPNIEYDFTPQYGTILHTAAGRPFWGHLGGFIDTSTGRGGGEGGSNGSPFTRGRNLPANVTKTAPDWVSEDGRWLLRFDGRGNHVVLPVETLPYRSGFRLCFEIRPSAIKEATLFIHHGYYIGSLALNMGPDGALYGKYCDYRTKVHKFNTNLNLKAGEWSRVEVHYDQNSIRISVDGRTSPAYRCPGRGVYPGTSVFGGFGSDKGEIDLVGNTGWFAGDLRALAIDHSVRKIGNK